MAQVSSRCDQMDAGCTARATFWPRRFQGRQMRRKQSIGSQKLFRPPVGVTAQPQLPTLLQSSPAESRESARCKSAPSASKSPDYVAPPRFASPELAGAEPARCQMRELPAPARAQAGFVDGCPVMPEQPRVAHVEIPVGASPGVWLATKAFGQEIRFQVPQGAVGGQRLQLSDVDGVVTVALLTCLAATATATAAAATATAAAASVDSKLSSGNQSMAHCASSVKNRQDLSGQILVKHAF